MRAPAASAREHEPTSDRVARRGARRRLLADARLRLLLRRLCHPPIQPRPRLGRVLRLPAVRRLRRSTVGLLAAGLGAGVLAHPGSRRTIAVRLPPDVACSARRLQPSRLLVGDDDDALEVCRVYGGHAVRPDRRPRRRRRLAVRSAQRDPRGDPDPAGDAPRVALRARWRRLATRRDDLADGRVAHLQGSGLRNTAGARGDIAHRAGPPRRVVAARPADCADHRRAGRHRAVPLPLAQQRPRGRRRRPGWKGWPPPAPR